MPGLGGGLSQSWQCQVLAAPVATPPLPGGANFTLNNPAAAAGCGISEGDTIVMTGGKYHDYVTRWVDTVLEVPSSSGSVLGFQYYNI